MIEIINIFLRRKQIKENMLSDNEYINWLSDFLKKQNYIDNETLELCDNVDNFSEYDIKQLNKISIFVETIFDYCYKNNIRNKYNETDELIYDIKYNNRYLRIVIFQNSEVKFYIQKLNSDSKETINYSEILKSNNLLERKAKMGKIEKTLLIALITVGILGTSFMIGMGIKQDIEKEEDTKSYSDIDIDAKVKKLRR